MQIFDVTTAKEEIRMDLILGWYEGGGGVATGVGFVFPSFGSEGLDVLERYGGVCFVDGVEGSFVSDVLFGDEGDSTPCV